MGRWAWVSLVALATLVGSADRAAAIPISEGMSTRFPPNVPNVIELYLAPGGSTTFALADPTFAFNYGQTWDYDVTNGGYNATLSTTADFSTFNTFPVLWTQGFEQDETTQQTFTVSWREVQYDWVGGVEVSSAWRSTDVVAPGGGGPPGVVPEPSTWLILGLGGLAAAARARRRRAVA